MSWLIPLGQEAHLLMHATEEQYQRYLAGDENAVFTAWRLEVRDGKLLVTT